MSRHAHPAFAVIAFITLFVATPTAIAVEDLIAAFRDPPASARPWVYWFWLNSNITREGITADLEAMQRVGIGGVLIMEVDQGAPTGNVPFMGPKWRELFKHVVAEAQRLGLEVNMNNDAGWEGSGGPWIKPEQAMQQVVWSEATIEGGRHFEGTLPQPKTKSEYYRDIVTLALPIAATATSEQLAYRIPNVAAKRGDDLIVPRDPPGNLPPPGCATPRNEIVDLTAQVDPAGRLTWDVPAGKWIVLRFGHTDTGFVNLPAPASGCGLECDKLSKEAIEAHFDAMLRKIISDVGPAVGKTLVSTHIDSWECGPQNWTPRMRVEFRKRRGYDMVPYLPVMSGRVVDSIEVSERFLWDVRQTISDLVAENYAGHLAKLAHKAGLRLSIEAYGGPFNDLAYGAFADEPMGEFWPDMSCFHLLKEMASASHTNGRPVTGAEAFTAGKRERWQMHPATIKTIGDKAFCLGINRMVIHRFAMQPWSDRAPGMTMGPWGQHYERTQTWWNKSLAWHQYLARCQYLLRQGQFVADICCLQPEGAPRGYVYQDPNGYDYDLCTPEVVFTRMKVEDGKLVLPDGMSYRLLVLPEGKAMTPRLLAKIKDLVQAGATVIGSKPSKSPSLENYPACDQEVQQLAEELWADCDGNGVKQHRLGTGRVIAGMTPEEVLAEMNVKPDFATDGRLNWIHRREGEAELYFVASSSGQPADAVCSFRVTGKQPEIWQPETGRIDKALGYVTVRGQTRLPIRFEANESLFVVFREPPVPGERITSVVGRGREMLRTVPRLSIPRLADNDNDESLPSIDVARGEIWQRAHYVIKKEDGSERPVESVTLKEPIYVNGPWDVRFPTGQGPPKQVTFDRLVSWSDHPLAGIRYFSGMASYRQLLNVPAERVEGGKRVILDLGNVQVMADVIVNGRRFNTLWKPPFRIDITDAVKAGDNALEVEVVNLWPNRLIGDEELPEDSDRNEDGTLKQWPQWLLDGKPSPTGRHTFTTWRLWKKGEGLLPSGLIGPVMLRTMQKFEK